MDAVPFPCQLILRRSPKPLLLALKGGSTLTVIWLPINNSAQSRVWCAIVSPWVSKLFSLRRAWGQRAARFSAGKRFGCAYRQGVEVLCWGCNSKQQASLLLADNSAACSWGHSEALQLLPFRHLQGWIFKASLVPN